MFDVDQFRGSLKEAMDSLPPLPPTAMRVVELANSPSSTARELLDVIRLDPILTTKILRLVNSSFFSLPQKVSSLKRALLLLGFNTVKNIALSSAMIIALKDNKGGKQQKILNDLWTHMLAVAVGSRELALRSKIPHQTAEEFFLCGLLSELGLMLIINRAFSIFDPLASDAQFNGTSLSTAIQNSLGISPAEVTLLMTQHWNLPDFIQNVMKENTAIQPNHVVSKAISLAERIARKNNIGYVCDLVHVDINSQEFGDLGIAPEEFAEVEESLSHLTETAMFLLETTS